MSDPLAANVVLLLPFEHTVDKGSCLDRSPYAHQVVPTADAWLSSAQCRIGHWAVQFAASGSGGALMVPHHPVFSFGAGDFCVETWVFLQAGGPTTKYLVSKGRYANSTRSWALAVDAGVFKALCSSNGSTLDINLNTSVAPLNDRWYHLALSRQGQTFRFFVDGVLSATTNTAAALNNETNPVMLGREIVEAWWFKGFLDGVRITRGAARYTSNFEPPTSEFEWAEPPIAVPRRVRGGMVRQGVFADLSLRDPNPLTRQTRNGRYAPVVGSARRILVRNAALPHREGHLGCQIAGTVAIKGELQNPPVSRPVSLYAHGSDRLIAQTRSDAQGHYRFDGLDPAQRYFVVAFDTDKHYRAVVADNLSPETLP